MNPVYVEGVGLCGPGLDGWAASLPVLIGKKYYVPAPTHVQPASLLPPNERRRAIQTVKLALAVGAEALTAARLDWAESATVFASSGGDGETIHQIMSVLASSDRELSPTRFHNSVHNTPSGYWGIATAARTPSTSLGCHDGSFAAGLIEAAVQATAEVRPVTLIAYDVPYPAPLGDFRPISAAFAVALVLSPKPTTATLACLTALSAFRNGRRIAGRPLEPGSTSMRHAGRAQPAAPRRPGVRGGFFCCHRLPR